MTVYGELKIYPLCVKIVKYLLKVVNSESIIIHHLHEALLDDFIEGKRNCIY